MSPPEQVGWWQGDVDLLEENQGLALEMERHRGKIMEHVAIECGKLKADIAGLKGQSKVWGAVAGVIASLTVASAIVLAQLLLGG